MARLFIAIDLPDDVKKEISAIRSDLPGARWVSEHQLHLTLRFVGDTDDALLGNLKEQLGAIDFPSFSMSLEGVGYFPGRGVPRILWAGLAAPPPLIALQWAIEQACVAAGTLPDERHFSPHITIARLREPASAAVSAFARMNAGFRSRPFESTAFHLYASTLNTNGAVHTILKTYPCLPS
jgi:2'-5' RNA ligase